MAPVASWWRRSLQTQVVVTTLVASGVVTVLLASMLLNQVGRGLVDAKVRAALVEVESGLLQSQAEVDAGGAAVDQTLQQAVGALAARGSTGDLYEVLLVGAETQTALASGLAGPADLPADLVGRVRSEQRTLYTFADIPVAAGREQGLLIGSVLSTAQGSYGLYHLFPLTAETQALNLVRRVAALAGGLLVLLLALIAGLVARSVVSPVKDAARTAERLAAGRLEERMQRGGEDELARLASSFNSMAEALQKQIGQLEDLSDVQRRFVSDVSHELRTPLSTIRMAADILHEERRRFAPHVSRSAELLHAELGRFETMLVDLLEISRYDAGAASLDAERVDVLHLVSRVLATVGPLAESRGSALTVHASRPVLAEVDPVRIERVLRNLVVNAIEHGEGRPVEISVRAELQTVVVVVQDQGVGLRPGQAGQVFTRFWRADPSRARTTGGTGLGLAIALEDVHLHGGELTAAGTWGQGATFRMTLPHRVRAPEGEASIVLADQPSVRR